LSGSFGLCASHCVSAFEYWMPPSRMMWVDPVARIASTIDCMPAAWYVPMGVLLPFAYWFAVQPSRQQAQAASLSLLPSGKGSLYGSSTTPSSSRNVVATSAQKAAA